MFCQTADKLLDAARERFRVGFWPADGKKMDPGFLEPWREADARCALSRLVVVDLKSYEYAQWERDNTSAMMPTRSSLHFVPAGSDLGYTERVVLFSWDVDLLFLTDAQFSDERGRALALDVHFRQFGQRSSGRWGAWSSRGSTVCLHSG
jgi:hypothetical protein